MPFATPATIPVDGEPAEPTVATLTFALLQAPPLVASLRAAVAPAHTCIVPVIAAGSGLTVTIAVAGLQPPANVYVITAVPGAAPVIAPVDDPVVAIAVLPLLQAPPVRVSANTVADPVHTSAVPVIAVGSGFTDIVTAVIVGPQLSVAE